MEPMKDALYIATYSAIEGGSLRKYYVGNNPDKVELKSDPKAVWKGLTKVKNMSWRALLNCKMIVKLIVMRKIFLS